MLHPWREEKLCCIYGYMWYNCINRIYLVNMKEVIIKMKAYQIKIELIDSKPLLWRRVIMPADATFKRLHDIIQNAMGFKGGYPHEYHLYEFELPEKRMRVTNDDEAYEEYKFYERKYKNANLSGESDIDRHIIQNIIGTTIRKPQSLKIDSYLERYKALRYVYDFGDYWQHLITLEKIIEDYPYGYPILVDGEGDCPPEDIGGISGYEEFLSVMADPNHEEYEHYKTWSEGQGYRHFDKAHVNKMLKFIKYKKTEYKEVK